MTYTIKAVAMYHIRQKNVEHVHTVQSMRLWMTIDCSGMLKMSTLIQTLGTVNELV